jgi:hypothetical protein
MVNVLPPCASTIPPPRRSSLPWWSFVSCPKDSPKRDLRDHLAPLLGKDPSAMTQGMTSYHLRRLRLHGLIERIPHTHRYSVTDFGLAAAVFLTRAHARFTGAALGDLVGADPPSPLRKAFERVDTELDRLAHRSRLVA